MKQCNIVTSGHGMDELPVVVVEHAFAVAVHIKFIFVLNNQFNILLFKYL